MSFSSFPASHTPSALQIIPYNGPPKPKKASRLNPSKVPPSQEILGIGPESNTRRRDKEDLIHTSHGSVVIDLTWLAGESDTENSGDESIGNGEHKSMRFEQSVPTATSRGDFSVESSSQPAPPEGSCQGTALVIENSPPVSDTNESCPREDGVGTQTSDQSEDSSIWSPDFRGQECSVRTEEAADGVGTPASGLPRRELTSTPPKPPIGSSTTNVEQPTLEASGHTLPKATTYQPQRQAYRKGQGKFPPLEITGSGSNGSDDDDDDDDSSNHAISLTLKRKRSPPAEQHSRTSNTISEQRPKRAAYSATLRKPYSRGRPFPNRPSDPKPLLMAQYSGFDTAICCSDDSSDNGSDESSDRGRHLGSNKRAKSSPRLGRSRNHGSVDKDEEYEVKRILEARVYRGTLQYRVEWVGYEDDSEWYNASNFENSPGKLREFHEANPAAPGPPRRLTHWESCWEKAYR